MRPEPDLEQRLIPAPQALYVAFALLAGGVCASWVEHLALGRWWDTAVHAGALVGVAALAMAARLGRLGGRAALLSALALCSLLFAGADAAASLWSGAAPFVWRPDPRLPLVFSLFGAAAGLLVTRWAAVAFGAGSVVLLTAEAAADGWADMVRFGFNLFVLGASVVLVWQTRGRVEAQMADLGRDTETAAGLAQAARARIANDEPFVAFSRSASGIVRDFGDEIDRIERAICGLGARDAAARSTQLEEIEVAVNQLAERIDLVKYAASATAERAPESINLRHLALAAEYSVRTLHGGGSPCRITIVVDAACRVAGRRLPLLDCIGTLFRAACDAGAGEVRLDALSAPAGLDGGVTTTLRFRADVPAIDENARAAATERLADFGGRLRWIRDGDSLDLILDLDGQSVPEGAS